MWYTMAAWILSSTDFRVFLQRETLQWRHNGHDSVLNHQSYDCLLNRLFKRRSKQTSKLRVTGPCARNSPETGEFPAQMASNAENVSIWWRHHESTWFLQAWFQQTPDTEGRNKRSLCKILSDLFYLFGLWFSCTCRIVSGNLLKILSTTFDHIVGITAW